MRRERGTRLSSASSPQRERIGRTFKKMRPSQLSQPVLSDSSDVVLVPLLSLVVVVLSRSRFLSQSNSSCAQQIRGLKSLA
ncbi:hypothetical protein FA13DRAFT_329252 [Coprinellus micaceus]|uniref:Uncharacterized protein n=1 Tax=Coprinellus micaceus TaxID=71717 RepID=A0A4Y7SDH8_COPMI|nr:hypothetical protein FA13DRAFT_329252 [Coprinellus micaceus]